MAEVDQLAVKLVWIIFVAEVASGADGGIRIVGALNETVLFRLFSVMFVIDLPVLVPLHDKELGIVVSVKEVLLLVPGNGNPLLSMTP